MQRSDSRERILLALIALLAVAVRALHLGRYSLWLDEAATWWNATRGSWLATAFAEPNHPPVWWLTTRASVLVFGDSEAALRLPAAISGCLAAWLAVPLARRLLRDEPGEPGSFAMGPVLLLALLAAGNGFLIEYSQEARMYSLLVAESIGLSLLLFDWLDRSRTGSLVAYGALAVVSVLTHFFALWPLAGHALFVLLRTGRRGSPLPLRRAATFWAVQSIALAVLLGWLGWAVRASPGVSTGGRFDALERLLYSLWRIGVGPALAAVDRPRVDAGLFALARAEWPILTTTALLWGGSLLLGAVRLRRYPEAAAFLGTAILVPIAGMLAIQWRLPLMHEKYLIALAPPMLIVAALGASTASRALRPVLVGGLIAVVVAGLAAYHFPDAPLVSSLLVRDHPYGHEQWRELQASIAAEGGPGAPVAFAHAYLELPWRYYDRGRRPWFPLPEVETGSRMLRDISTRSQRDLEIARATRAGAYFILAHDRDADRAADIVTIATTAGMPVTTVEAHVVLWPRSWGIRELPPLVRTAAGGTTPERAGGR